MPKRGILIWHKRNYRVLNKKGDQIFTLKITSGSSWDNRNWIYPLAWNNNKEKINETTVFNILNIWQIKKDSDSWDIGNKGDKTYDCLSLLPGHGTGRGKWVENLQQHWLQGFVTCTATAQKGPVLDLMLCSCHFEILNNFYKGSTFSFLLVLPSRCPELRQWAESPVRLRQLEFTGLDNNSTQAYKKVYRSPTKESTKRIRGNSTCHAHKAEKLVLFPKVTI